MPHDDLSGFRRLVPDGGIVTVLVFGSNVSTKRSALQTQQLVQREVSSWQNAVAQLWRTPLPRVIVVTGGDTFTVIGGKTLNITGETIQEGDVSRDVFWYAQDAEAPSLGVGLKWVSANPTRHRGPWMIWCLGA